MHCNKIVNDFFALHNKAKAGAFADLRRSVRGDTTRGIPAGFTVS